VAFAGPPSGSGGECSTRPGRFLADGSGDRRLVNRVAGIAVELLREHVAGLRRIARRERRGATVDLDGSQTLRRLVLDLAVVAGEARAQPAGE
jgi:hypothetical protein